MMKKKFGPRSGGKYNYDPKTGKTKLANPGTQGAGESDAVLNLPASDLTDEPSEKDATANANQKGAK